MRKRPSFYLFVTILLPLLASIGLWLILAGSARAADLEVCASGCPYTTINGALENAASGDTIIVGAGVYTETLDIYFDVNIRAEDGFTPTIRGVTPSLNQGRVIYVNTGAAFSLEGFIVENGKADNTIDGGGGLHVESGTVTVTDVLFRENTAGQNGGGVYNEGVLTLDNVTFDGNTAVAGGAVANAGTLTYTNGMIMNNSVSGLDSAGGGVFNSFNSSFTIQNVTIEGNSAVQNGGGVYNVGAMDLSALTIRGNDADSGGGVFNEGQLDVQNSEIISNTAAGDGGGIANRFELQIDTSTVAYNTAGRGAGIFIDGSLTMTKTTIHANTSGGPGGGIHFGDADDGGETSMVIINSTISGNSAVSNGGGLSGSLSFTGDVNVELTNVTIAENDALLGAGGIHNNGAALRLRNTIVADSVGSTNCAGTIVNLGGNLATDGSCSFPGNGMNAGLGPLQDNGGDTLTHALLDDSMAISIGSSCPLEDQPGNPRTPGLPCDSGAFESEKVRYFNYMPFVRK